MPQKMLGVQHKLGCKVMLGLVIQASNTQRNAQRSLYTAMHTVICCSLYTAMYYVNACNTDGSTDRWCAAVETEEDLLCKIPLDELAITWPSSHFELRHRINAIWRRKHWQEVVHTSMCFYCASGVPLYACASPCSHFYICSHSVSQAHTVVFV